LLLHVLTVARAIGSRTPTLAWQVQEMGLASSPSSSSGSSSSRRQPSGVGVGISRFAVGTLSLWLRAYEAGVNAVDSAISCLDIGTMASKCQNRCR
jgi:hypothetical protein